MTARNRTVKVTIVGDAKHVRQAFGDAGKAAGVLTGNFGRLMGTAGAIGVGLALKRLGGQAIGLAGDFDESMSKIIGLVGVSREQVDAWRGDLKRMSGEVGIGPQALADALFFVTSAGLRGAEALDVLRQSAKASAAGLGETKVIADLVTSAVNAYGIENLSASKATDILVAAVREGKAEAPEFASQLGKVLPVAAEMGVTFDQVAGAVAAMSRTGTDAATATTQLRAMMVSLLKPSVQAEKALGEMGTSSAALRSEIRDKGLLSALQRVRELTNRYGEDALAKVFPNIRALAGVLDLMGSNAAENERILEALTDTTGALDHAFATAEQSLKFRLNQALTNLHTLGTEVGEKMFPALLQIVEAAGPIFETLGGALVSIFDVLGPLATILGGVASALGAVFKVIGPGVLVALALWKGMTGLVSVAGMLHGAFLKLRNSAQIAAAGLGPQGVMGAVNPLTIAVGAAVTIFTLWNEQKRQARERAKELRDTLDEQTNAITDNTVALAKNNLEQSGNLQTLNKVEVAVGDFVDTATAGTSRTRDLAQAITGLGGHADAAFRRVAPEHQGFIQRLRDAVDAGTLSRREAEQLARQLGDLSNAYADATVAADADREATERELVAREMARTGIEDYDKALQNVQIQQAAAAEGALDLADAEGELGESTDDLTAKYQSLTRRLIDAQNEKRNLMSVMREAVSPVHAASQATERLRRAEEALKKAQDDRTISAEELARIELDAYLARLEAQAALGDAASSYETIDQMVRETAIAFGLSDQKAAEFLETLGLISNGDWVVHFRADVPEITYLQQRNQSGQTVLTPQVTRKPMARGGVATGPTDAIFGEAGREAVVPLESNEGINYLAEALALALTRLGVAGGAGGHGVMQVTIELDGATIGRKILRHQADHIRVKTGIRK